MSEHPLNAICPDCPDAAWLHTADGCLALRANGQWWEPAERCGCSRTAADFAHLVAR